uniref:BED-type domain-containing protein n=1 Tax=Acrobeloides nanus TaxID=290746 RepID=A0A914C0H6_9BILA
MPSKQQSSSDNNSSLTLQTRGPMKRHSLWQYFSFDEEKKRSLCKHCTYTVAGNYTTTLKTHLRNHHRPLYIEMEKKEDERLAGLPVKRNASGNNLLEFAKKGRSSINTENLQQTSQSGGIVAYSIAGPDITAAFKVHKLDNQDESGMIQNFDDIMKEETKDDMPELEEEPPTSHQSTHTETSLSCAEIILKQTKHVHNRYKNQNLNDHQMETNIEENHIEEEPDEDDFETFQIPDVTSCLKKFHKKIVDLSKENRLLKLKMGVLEKRIVTLEGQQQSPQNLASNLTNGFSVHCVNDRTEPCSEFDMDTPKLTLDSENGVIIEANNAEHRCKGVPKEVVREVHSK